MERETGSQSKGGERGWREKGEGEERGGGRDGMEGGGEIEKRREEIER